MKSRLAALRDPFRVVLDCVIYAADEEVVVLFEALLKANGAKSFNAICKEIALLRNARLDRLKHQMPKELARLLVSATCWVTTTTRGRSTSRVARLNAQQRDESSLAASPCTDNVLLESGW
jgi:hypothetical protein